MAFELFDSAQNADRADAGGAVAAFQFERGLDDFQHRLDFRIAFLRQRLFQQRQHRIFGAAGEFLGGGEAHRAVRRQELERRQRGGQFAAQAVVRADVFAFGGQRGYFHAGHGVDAILAFDDEHLLARGLQLAVSQRLQQRGRLRVAFGDERRDGGYLFVALAEREFLHDFGIKRACGKAQQQQQ